MYGLIIFLVMPFLLTVLFINHKIKHANAGFNMEDYLSEYIARDQKANFTRRKNFDDIDIIKIDSSNLQILSEEDVASAEQLKRAYEMQCIAIKKAERPMTHMLNVDNIELKERYGIGNFQNIVTYEENFNDFMHFLIKWSMELIRAGKDESAAVVLEYALTLGSDYSKVYINLADIYSRLQNMQKLIVLRDKSLEGNLGAMRNRISAHIQQRINQLGD